MTKIKTKLSAKDKHLILLGNLIQTIKSQISYFGVYLPYEKWNQKTLKGITKKEFTFAVEEASNLYGKEIKKVIDKMKINKKIKITSNE